MLTDWLEPYVAIMNDDLILQLVGISRASLRNSDKSNNHNNNGSSV
jgi:hypothetical protein